MGVDLVQAAHWFGQAADSGHVDAAYQLGILFDEHPALAPQRAAAGHWLQLAAGSGHEEAQALLAERRAISNFQEG